MPPSAASDWRGRTSGFLSFSSVKLRQATQVAGDVAKNAGTSVAGAADRAGSAVLTRWSLLQGQQPNNSVAQDGTFGQDRPTVQERWRTASTCLKKGLQETKEIATMGFQDTKDKVAVGLVETKEKLSIGKVKVEEAARKAAQCSKILIADWRQKGIGGKGLTAEYIFKKDGNHRVVDRLILTITEDPNAVLQGVNPVDVAALLKVFFQTLPEPLLMSENYDVVVGARGNVRRLREIVATLPPAHHSTLKCLTALLLRISQKSTVNKMDSHRLAFEFAPVLLWQTGRNKSYWEKLRPSAAGSSRLSRLTPVIERSREEAADLSEHQRSSVLVRVNVEELNFEYSQAQGAGDGQPIKWHTLDEANGDLSQQISLDDDEPHSVDFAIVEAVQCLIDQRNIVFTDTVEADFQALDS